MTNGTTNGTPFSGKAVLVLMTDVEAAVRELEELKPPQMNLRQAVERMQAGLVRALSLGHDYESLSLLLARQQIPISAATLKKYLLPFQRAASGAGAIEAGAMETPSLSRDTITATTVDRNGVAAEAGEMATQFEGSTDEEVPATPPRELATANGSRSGSRSGSTKTAAATKTTAKNAAPKATGGTRGRPKKTAETQS